MRESKYFNACNKEMSCRWELSIVTGTPHGMIDSTCHIYQITKRSLRKMGFENILGKTNDAGYQYFSPFYSLKKRSFLSKMKAFADGNFSIAAMMLFACLRVENIVGKEENVS